MRKINSQYIRNFNTFNFPVSIKSGFTLIELLTGIAILVFISSIAIGSFKNFSQNQILNTEVNKTTTLLREVRAKTVFSKNDSVYGLHVEAIKVTSFKGGVFILNDPNNKEFIFNTSVEISTTTLVGGGSDIIFQRLTGKTNQYGTIVLRLKNNLSKIKTIQISKTGVIEVL